MFYFLSIPVVNLLTGKDLMSEEELESRRKAAVEFLGQTVFSDREHGAQVAARVLVSTAMPPVGDLKNRWKRFAKHEVKQK